MKWIQSILDNNSVFGQLMTRCGILIAANILFILFSIPIVTAGASFAALYYTMLKVLRGEDELNPFRTFWQGFRENFKQGTIAWLILLAFGIVLCLEVFWCSQFTGPVALFRYGLYALLFIEVVIASYAVPHRHHRPAVYGNAPRRAAGPGVARCQFPEGHHQHYPLQSLSAGAGYLRG